MLLGFFLALSAVLPTARAEAACSVPNTISNGQTADATAVMDNFNALNNCINSGVSPSGSTAAGNLPVFSSANTITRGDLSGDCTTAGTLAVTCTKSNGAPLSYFATGTDAGQLTGTVPVARFNNGVDADSLHYLRGDGVWATPSGGGGGGGTWWAGHAPQPADFTLWHGATASNIDLTLSYDANVGLIMDTTVLAGENVRYAEKAAPSHSADFTITAHITPNLYPSSYSIVGQTLRETGGNVSVIFGFYYGGPYIAVRSQTGTSFIANRASEQRITSNSPYWSRIHYVQSADTYYFDFSVDGKAWVTIYSGTRTTLFGASITPTKAGLGFYVNNGTANKHSMASCDYFVIE